MFAEDGADFEEFYDFSEAMRVPDAKIAYENMRMLNTVCMLPNRHVLIEGGFMEAIVEVY